MATGHKSTLAENAGAGNGTATEWPGGKGYFVANATFGGGSVKLQMQMPNPAATWIDVPSASLTAAGAIAIDLPAGQIRSVIATSTAVYAYVIRS